MFYLHSFDNQNQEGIYVSWVSAEREQRYYEVASLVLSDIVLEFPGDLIVLCE